MTYMPEGSHEQYCSTADQKPYIYSWGWLGDKVEDKNKSWKDQSLKAKISQKLKEVGGTDDNDKYCVHCTRGFHICDICHHGIRGNAEIHISYKGKLYICPSGVYHYIENHDYKPDDEVIDAILNGYYCTEEEDLTPDWNRAGVNWDKRHLTDQEDEEMQIAIEKEWERVMEAILLKGKC